MPTPEETEERITGVTMRITARQNDAETYVVFLPPPNRHPNLFTPRFEKMRPVNPEFFESSWSERVSREVNIPTLLYHDTYKEQQGFATNLREHITRAEAMLVAKKSGQFLRYSGTQGTELLFSEDLW